MFFQELPGIEHDIRIVTGLNVNRQPPDTARIIQVPTVDKPAPSAS